MRDKRQNPNRLSERVHIEGKTITQGDQGETVTTWKRLFSTYAFVRNQSGSEVIHGGKVTATGKTIFQIRNQPHKVPTTQDRIIWNDQEYNIDHVPPVSRRELYIDIYSQWGTE